MNNLVWENQIYIGDYVCILDSNGKLYAGELIGIDPADWSESGEDEYIIQSSSSRFAMIKKSDIEKLEVIDGFIKIRMTIEAVLRDSYIAWEGNIYTRQDSLLPVVKIRFDEKISSVTVDYYSDLECSTLLRTETFESPSIESVLDSIDWGMYREDWFTSTHIYNNSKEWNLIAPVDSFQCIQHGIRKPFITKEMTVDASDLPGNLDPKDVVIVLIRIPVAIKNMRGESSVLFYRRGFLEGDTDSVQLKRIHIGWDCKTLYGEKNGYAFAMKSVNPQNSNSVSFRYGLLNRGIKAIVKNSSVKEIIIKAAWIRKTNKSINYKAVLKKMLNNDISDGSIFKEHTPKQQKQTEQVQESKKATPNEVPNMDERMIILFPSDFFDKDVVDEDLKKEYDAVIKTGLFDVLIFSYDDWFNHGILKLNGHAEGRTMAIYRGWMMTPEQYSRFIHELWKRDISLIVWSQAYETMHCFPNVFPALAADTPPILVFPEGESVDLNVIKKHFHRFKLKDYVKSVKGDSFPQYFTSDISEEEFFDWLDKFYQFRGDLFTGGICIKEYVDLKRYDGKTNEYRVYYVRGEIISISRNSLQINTTPEPPSELVQKYAHLNSPFYTVDYAEKDDGSWIIIETGDGQVSGLSEGKDYEAFFRALYHAMTRDLEWRWCLVGNVVKTREYGEDHELVNGTKQFSGGTKVYIAPVQWGDGFENVIVLGKPRGKKGGLIEMVIRRKHIENFRLKKIYDPGVLKRMNKSKHTWWENRDFDRDEIISYVEYLTTDDAN